eukprot:26226-Eustigmatos_ZCMA.PRE.1
MKRHHVLLRAYMFAGQERAMYRVTPSLNHGHCDKRMRCMLATQAVLPRVSQGAHPPEEGGGGGWAGRAWNITQTQVVKSPYLSSAQSTCHTSYCHWRSHGAQLIVATRQRQAQMVQGQEEHVVRWNFGQ